MVVQHFADRCPTIYRSISSEIYDISTDVLEEIRKARIDTDRRQVIGWLSKSALEPSKEHHLARKKHEATTGSWLLNSVDFKTWMSSKNSLLWLYSNGKC